MEIKVRIKLNDKQEVEGTFTGENIKESVKMAGVFLDFDGKCGLCGKEDFKLQTRTSKDKQYTFTEFICNTCGGKRSFGEYKNNKGCFLKPWEEKYVPQGE